MAIAISGQALLGLSEPATVFGQLGLEALQHHFEPREHSQGRQLAVNLDVLLLSHPLEPDRGPDRTLLAAGAPNLHTDPKPPIEPRVLRADCLSFWAMRMRESSDPPAGLRSPNAQSPTVMVKASPRVDVRIFGSSSIWAIRVVATWMVSSAARMCRDPKLVVLVSGAQAPQPRHLGLQPGLLHQPGVAGGERLGHGELVGLLRDVL